MKWNTIIRERCAQSHLVPSHAILHVWYFEYQNLHAWISSFFRVGDILRARLFGFVDEEARMVAGDPASQERHFFFELGYRFGVHVRLGDVFGHGY